MNFPSQSSPPYIWCHSPIALGNQHGDTDLAPHSLCPLVIAIKNLVGFLLAPNFPPHRCNKAVEWRHVMCLRHTVISVGPWFWYAFGSSTWETLLAPWAASVDLTWKIQTKEFAKAVLGQEWMGSDAKTGRPRQPFEQSLGCKRLSEPLQETVRKQFL